MVLEYARKLEPYVSYIIYKFISNSKTDLFTLVIGQRERDVALESSIGQMDRSTKDTGKTTQPTVKVDLFMLMEMSMYI